MRISRVLARAKWDLRYVVWRNFKKRALRVGSFFNRDLMWERGRLDGRENAFNRWGTPKSSDPDYLMGWQWGREESNSILRQTRIESGAKAPKHWRSHA